MGKHENIFYLRLYQSGNPQLVKNYISGLCNKLNEKNLDYQLDLYLDNMFQDEVYDGGRGPNTTYPYIKFEKVFDDMGNYLSIDMNNMNNMNVSTPDIQTHDTLSEILSEADTPSIEQPTVSSCSELLAKIPDDMQNEIVFELRIHTETPQIYNRGGVMQLEYLLKNM
jgi:hypothetical protein